LKIKTLSQSIDSIVLTYSTKSFPIIYLHNSPQSIDSMIFARKTLHSKALQPTFSRFVIPTEGLRPERRDLLSCASGDHRRPSTAMVRIGN
jgi:hypothetical protein